MAIDRIAPTIRPDLIPSMYQEWRHLTFLHWTVDPEIVKKTLPPGLQVDTFEASAYLGVIPFTMRNVRPRGLPTAPWLSHFHEFNVRTYVVDRHGRPGVWFYSLDAANPISVAIARTWFHLPYFYARMSVHADEDRERHYRSTRLSSQGRSAALSLSTRVSGPSFTAEPDTLEHFLIERYLLFSSGRDGLYMGQVHHVPYPIQLATAELHSESLLEAAGFARPDIVPLVHYSEGVEVEIFGLEPVD